MKDETTTWIIVGVVALALLYWFSRRKKVVVAKTVVGTVQSKPTVTVNGTTVQGGIAGSSLVQGAALGLAAAPAVSGLFGSLFSSPTVAGNAPADNTAAAFGDLDASTGGYDSTGLDLVD